jgi:threonine synthase
MKFVSTRAVAVPVTIDQALIAGLAADGGLYVPETIPALSHLKPLPSLAETACVVLSPYFSDSILREQLPLLCKRAFSFDAPLRTLNRDNDYCLELFHGPTAAFKDYAARFLAESIAALNVNDDAPVTIVVATSGDTGAAVAAAFHRRPGFNVVILYPDGKVSPRQAHGLGCWGDNVRAFRVAGTFDDCQRLAKAVLSDKQLRSKHSITSANSISLGRLLPQAAYYAHTAMQFNASRGEPLNFIVPTGNLGNACAALLAQRMGAPIGEIRLATNANDVLPRFFAGDDYSPTTTKVTLANAMDVGAPSNFERLRYWHVDDVTLRNQMHAQAVEDEIIKETIRHAPKHHGIIPCPHTATALHVLEQLRVQGDSRPWAVVATAHPAKFESIVEPLVGHRVELPDALAQCLHRPSFAEPMNTDYNDCVMQIFG